MFDHIESAAKTFVSSAALVLLLLVVVIFALALRTNPRDLPLDQAPVNSHRYVPKLSPTQERDIFIDSGITPEPKPYTFKRIIIDGREYTELPSPK